MKYRKGKFVQEYTKRGSPRSGNHQYEWKPDEDLFLERFALILVLLILAGVLIYFS